MSYLSAFVAIGVLACWLIVGLPSVLRCCYVSDGKVEILASINGNYEAHFIHDFKVDGPYTLLFIGLLATAGSTFLINFYGYSSLLRRFPVAEKVDKKANAAPDAIEVSRDANYYYPHQPRPTLMNEDIVALA